MNLSDLRADINMLSDMQQMLALVMERVMVRRWRKEKQMIEMMVG